VHEEKVEGDKTEQKISILGQTKRKAAKVYFSAQEVDIG
jgi:hypothetical protein